MTQEKVYGNGIAYSNIAQQKLKKYPPDLFYVAKALRKH